MYPYEKVRLMQRKILKNFFYHGTYQILAMIFSMIAVPIVSKALGSTGVGLFKYITSITTYFMMIAGMGLSTYAVRKVSSVKQNRTQLNRTFWEIECFNAIFTTGTLLSFFVLLFFVEDKIYFIVSGLTIFAVYFDISWFFYGMEKYQTITQVNILVKLVSCLATIFFIRSESDLMLYFLIQALTILLSNVLLWLFVFKEISFTKISVKAAFGHFFSALKFLAGNIATIVYSTFGKTMLGLIGTTSAVGIYANSLVLITMCITIISMVDNVLLPHMTQLFVKKQEDQLVITLTKSLHLQLFFSIPMMFGIMATASKVVPWFFGDDFLLASKIIPWLAPIIVMQPLSLSISSQFLIPMNRMKEYNTILFLTGGFSFATNLLFISLLGLWGAVLVAVVSEVFVLFFRVSYLKKKTTFAFDWVRLGRYIVAGLVMFCLIQWLTAELPATMATTAFQLIIGGISYNGLTFLFRVNPIPKLLKI